MRNSRSGQAQRGVRWMVAGCVSAAAFLVAGVAAAGQVPSAAELLQALVKWQTSLPDLEARYTLSRFEPTGEPEQGTLTVQRAAGGRLRIVRTLPGGAEVFVSDGQTLVRAQGGTAVPVTWQTEPALAPFAVPDLGGFLRAGGIDLMASHLDHIDARVQWVLGGSPQNRDLPQLWFDREKRRPSRLVYEHPAGRTLVVEWSGLSRAAARGLVPAVLRVRMAGRLREEAHLETLTAPARFERSTFALPSVPPAVPATTPGTAPPATP